MSGLEKTAWFFFIVTCILIVFVQPYLFTLHGHQADIYGGLMCAISLMTALAAARTVGAVIKPSHLMVSLVLLLLAMISGAFSSTPLASSVRSFFLMSAGLGGFWCSQILLHSESGKRVFMWLCTAIFIGCLAISLVTYSVWGKTIHHLIDPNPRTLLNRILLLSLGPIALISSRKPLNWLLGFPLLYLSYIALVLDAIGFNRSLYTASIILLTSSLLLLVFGRWSKIQLVLVLSTGAVAVITAVYVFSPILSKVLHPRAFKEETLAIAGRDAGRNHDTVAAGVPAGYVHWYESALVLTIVNDNRIRYRLENYPFAWHIVKQHPVIGIGLETPLNQFLWNYEPRLTQWPNRQLFGEMVRKINSLDNMYLAFMVYLGLPFLLVYVFALLVLLWRLLRIAWRPPPGFGIHPLAILIPLVASMMYFVDLDGLLHGDINWYFHVLLGLIPVYSASSK